MLENFVIILNGSFGAFEHYSQESVFFLLLPMAVYCSGFPCSDWSQAKAARRGPCSHGDALNLVSESKCRKKPEPLDVTNTIK